jgi:hypothetical protein
MDTLFWLTDRYGPRLTGSPGVNDAAEWTMKKMTEWGLANVHREDWDFGRSWSLVRFSAHLVDPQIQPLIGFPKTWSVGTEGPVTAEVVRATLASEADLAKFKGQLKGKIVDAAVTRRPCARRAVRQDGWRLTESGDAHSRRGRGGRGDRAASRGGPPAASARRPTIRTSISRRSWWRDHSSAGCCGDKDEGRAALLDRGSDADTANMGQPPSTSAPTAARFSPDR